MAAQKPKPKSVIEQLGPRLWDVFHKNAAKGNITLEWLKHFHNKIPCGSCKSKFEKIVAENPPPQDATQFAWSVRMHNFVNADPELNKPQMPLELAASVYGVANAPGDAKPPEGAPTNTPTLPETTNIEMELPVRHPFHDNNMKAAWAIINESLAAGRKVTAEIIAAPQAIDMITLARVGQDNTKAPVFGVTRQTQILVKLKMMVTVGMPALTVESK
jgi:hypothetical protein